MNGEPVSCRDERPLLLYVDGELPPDEVSTLEAHLAACPSCRRRVAALRAENDFIGEALRETELALAPAPQPRERELGWLALAAAVAAAGIHLGLEVLAQLDAQLGWLSPFSQFRQVSALLRLVFLLTQENIPMLFAPLAAVATALLLGAAFVFLARRRPAAVAALLLVFVTATPALATEIRRPADDQGGVVLIPAGETIDDTVFAVGKSVVVEGTVTGDLIALAKRVHIAGEVRGSLVALGRDVVVAGSIGGDVYSGAQNIDVRGKVLRSVNAAGEEIDIQSGAHIGRDAFLFCEGGRVGGTVGRDVRASGDVFTISGEVTRSVDVSGHELDLAATARIGGDVTATLEDLQSFTRAPGAQLAREPQVRASPKGQDNDEAGRWLTPSFYFWQAVYIAAALAFGLFLYWLLPALFAWVTPPTQSLLRRSGIGFLALVATPIAALLVGITVVGLPIGILTLGLWGAALFLSSIFVALAVGQALLRSPRAGTSSFILALLTGLVLIRIAVNLPYLGCVLHFFVIIVGLGLLLTQASRLASRLRRPAAP